LGISFSVFLKRQSAEKCYLAFEIFKGGKVTVYRGITQVGNLIQFSQWRENGHTDFLSFDLSLACGAESFLYTLGQES
jgi:hypothetical protein